MKQTRASIANSSYLLFPNYANTENARKRQKDRAEQQRFYQKKNWLQSSRFGSFGML